MAEAPAIRPALPAWGLFAALAGFLALQFVAFMRAGVFEYPLDDVYIHLAMASNIARGTYGVNAGEAASAASSILYPFLLVPFPDSAFQRYLPLFWNTLAVAGCGWVWGVIVAEARLTGPVAWLIVLAAPVAFNISGVGFTGMEAGLHVLASLLIVLGLWRALSGRGVSGWFIAAAIAAPLLRYEGLALSLLAATTLALHGHRRSASVITAGAVGGVVAFSLFLVWLGLDPVPGSVLAKTAGLDTAGNLPLRLLLGLFGNLAKPAGVLLAAMVVTSALLLAAFPALRRGRAFWIVAVTGSGAAAHLFLGQIGWLHRYEPYILVSLFGAILLGSTALSGRALQLVRAAAVVAILVAGSVYLPTLWGAHVWNPRAIHVQQAQMARFAQDYLKVPVAVNDLGRVAWGNPDYVLDIWGLGSAEARAIRFGATPPADGWAGPLARAQGIKAAMIYDFWFESAVGPDWVRVGELTMDPEKGEIGAWKVSFYATDPDYAPEMREKLAAFAATLPDGAELRFGGGE